MYCTKCGCKVISSQKNCPFCGNSISDEKEQFSKNNSVILRTPVHPVLIMSLLGGLIYALIMIWVLPGVIHFNTVLLLLLFGPFLFGIIYLLQYVTQKNSENSFSSVRSDISAQEKILCESVASYANINSNNGRLCLTEHRLIFYSTPKHQIEWIYLLSDCDAKAVVNQELCFIANGKNHFFEVPHKEEWAYRINRALEALKTSERVNNL